MADTGFTTKPFGVTAREGDAKKKAAQPKSSGTNKKINPIDYRKAPEISFGHRGDFNLGVDRNGRPVETGRGLWSVETYGYTHPLRLSNPNSWNNFLTYLKPGAELEYTFNRSGDPKVSRDLSSKLYVGLSRSYIDRADMSQYIDFQGRLGIDIRPGNHFAVSTEGRNFMQTFGEELFPDNHLYTQGYLKTPYLEGQATYRGKNGMLRGGVRLPVNTGQLSVLSDKFPGQVLGAYSAKYPLTAYGSASVNFRGDVGRRISLGVYGAWNVRPETHTITYNNQGINLLGIDPNQQSTSYDMTLKKNISAGITASILLGAKLKD